MWVQWKEADTWCSTGTLTAHPPCPVLNSLGEPVDQSYSPTPTTLLTHRSREKLMVIDDSKHERLKRQL